MEGERQGGREAGREEEYEVLACCTICSDLTDV